jgi:glutamate-1-semialdehyde 2,1-aminomutase
MCGLGAFVETVAMLREESIVDHLWAFGARLIDGLNAAARDAGVADHFKAYGYPCSPYFVVRDAVGAVSLPCRTLVLQEMVKHGVLMPWIALSYRHGDEELQRTIGAAREAFCVLRRALTDGIDRYLEGEAIKPVFRQFN